MQCPLSPPFTLQTKHARESRYNYYKSTKYYQYFFMKGKRNISSLHKIICSLVSLFLWHIMKVVAACKVPSVFNHISPIFLQTSFILKRKHKILQTFNTIWRWTESTLIFSCENAHYSCSIRLGYWVVPSRIFFFKIQFLKKHFDFL